MLPEDYSILTELLEEMKREAGETRIRMSANFRRIREAEVFMGDLKASEAEDFKIFSPRRAEVLHRKELQEAQESKAGHERENEELADRRKLLDGRIGRLQAFLDCLELEKQREAHEAEAGDFQAKMRQSLKELADKLDRSSVYMERNPVQARQDLTIVAKRLRELAERTEKTGRTDEE